MTPVSEEEHELNNRVPSRPTPELKFDEDEGDTLSNHNSITALLSSKFRVRKGLVHYVYLSFVGNLEVLYG